MNKVTVTAGGKNWQVVLRSDADKSVAAEIFKLREYRIIEEYIKNCSEAIIDVGAHSGLFTLYIRSFNSTVPIFSVEPEPENSKLLKAHLKENLVMGVEVIPAALAGKNGMRQLLVTPDSHNHRLVSELESPAQTIPVVTLSLSTLCSKYNIEHIGLIKMDIEGGEYEVFDSLTDNEYSRIGAVIMEYHKVSGRRYQEIEQTLREHGFGVQVFPSKFDKTMGFLWAINKRAK